MFACVLAGLRSSCYVATVRVPGGFKVLMTMVSSTVKDRVLPKTPAPNEAAVDSYLWTLINNKITEMNLVMLARTDEVPPVWRVKVKPDSFADCSVVMLLDDWQRAALKTGVLLPNSVTLAHDNMPPWFRELVVNERSASGSLHAVLKDQLIPDPHAFQSGAFRQPDPQSKTRIFTFTGNIFGNPDYY